MQTQQIKFQDIDVKHPETELFEMKHPESEQLKIKQTSSQAFESQSQNKNLYLLMLEKEKAEIESEIGRFEDDLRLQIDPDIDEADPGMSIQLVTVALLKNAKRKVEAIEHAIEQSLVGGYGICEACRQAINPERMKIFPQATFCVPCKSKKEVRTYHRAV